MVEPVGAMAMFVLRLAGLLSLENALQDQEANFTDSTYNLTHLTLYQNLSAANLTWLGTEDPTFVPSPSVPNESSGSLNFTAPTSPTLRFLALSTVNTTLSSSTTLHSTGIPAHSSGISIVQDNNTYITPTHPLHIDRAQDHNVPSPQTNFSHINITQDPNTPAPFKHSSHIDQTQSHRMPVPHINLNYNRNIQKSNRTHIPSIRRRKVTRGQMSSGRSDYIRSSQASHATDAEAKSSSSGSVELPELTDVSVDQQIPRPKISADHRSESEFQSEGQEMLQYNDLVQYSTTSSSVKRLASYLRSDLTSELYPESFSPITPLPVTAGVPFDHGTQESSSSSSSSAASTRPHPRLEMLAEDDDQLLGLLDDTKLRSLEAPPEDFVENDFEYYDFGVHHPDNWQTEAPTLSSRNLVSAVPVGRFASAPVPGEPVQREYTEEIRLPQPTKPKKLPPARPIPPAYPRSGMRNNPYPYGPKLLPGPYAPLTPNLPSATEDDPMDRHITAEYSYEEDFDYYYDSHDSEDSRFEVQTKEPPVLFVFDKPGYTPEAPTTLLPATRAATPSDPWDCAPRCPRYVLLDWNTDYDVRQYPQTLWVSTVIISENRVLAELEGYMRVQDYFYGLNDQGRVLNLTIPFVTQIKCGQHPGVLQETNDYTVSLYVQPSYTLDDAAELPTPISNEVLVDDLEPKTVFVHSFEANVWDVTKNFLEDKVETLMNQLRHNGEAFLDRYYYLASYSRPELYQPVYYEVWVYATNFRDPQSSSSSSSSRSSLRRMPQTNKVTKKTLNKLCRGVECPTFEVLRTYKYGIQKRRYLDGLFASTSPNECQFTTMSVWKGFMPLHLYKHGINSHMEVIEATRPIALVNIRDSSDPTTECPQNMTMSIYLPKRLHSNPPITGYDAPEVHISKMNDVIVYAYTIGGYLLDPKRVRKELADMKYRLSEFGACYKDDEYYVVIYDFIVRYHGRQNEIWIVAENCKATHNG